MPGLPRPPFRNPVRPRAPQAKGQETVAPVNPLVAPAPADAPSEIAIRTATDDDLPALLDLEKECFPDPWGSPMLAAELRQPLSFVLVAVATEGPTVGYAAFRTMADEGELLRLAVHPDLRRRGVGLLLIEAGLATLSARAVVSCFLEVRAENQAAIGLYERSGFASTGRRKGYYRDGTDALVYVRSV